MLMEESKEMKEAGEKLLDLNADKAARELAEAREMSQWAFNLEVNARIEKEHKRAEAEKLAEKLEIAKNLINNGVSIDIITDSTQLSKTEILNLKPEG